MNTVAITSNKIEHWEQYRGWISSHKIFCIKFDDLNVSQMDNALKLLEKMTKFLDSITTIVVENCSFSESTAKRFSQIVKSSVRSIIFSNTKFHPNATEICKKIQKLSKLGEMSFTGVDLRNSQKELCKLLMAGKTKINIQLLNSYVDIALCHDLYETMKKCSNLTSLELQHVKLDKNNMVSAISMNKSLTRLIVQGNDSESYDLADLAKSKAKTKLLELHLRNFVWGDEKSCNMLGKIGEYGNLTKLVIGKIFYFPDKSKDLAESIQKLTNLKALDISQLLYFGPDMLDTLVATTTITDLICTRSQFNAVHAKCQRVNKSVNFTSLSFVYPPSGNNVQEPDIFASILQLGGLTKIEIESYFEVDDLIAGLNLANCKLAELIIWFMNNPDTVKLLTALEKNSALKKLSLKYSSLNAASDVVCKLIRGNTTLRSFSLTEEKRFVPSPPNEDVIDALKVNKTLLYLEMPPQYHKLTDRVVDELIAVNSQLLTFSPVSSDYRVDMWLQRNKQLRGTSDIVLRNIVRTGSVLPIEIWVKIFSCV